MHEGHQWTPLNLVAVHGSRECILALLRAGAHGNNLNPARAPPAPVVKGRPLHLYLSREGKGGKDKGVAFRWDAEVVAALVSAGADVHARVADGRTPLHFAAASGQADVVEVLLESAVAVADVGSRRTVLESYVNERARDGAVALHYAHGEAVKVLLRAGGRADALDRAGNSVLHVQTERLTTAEVAIFVRQGVDLDAENNDGYRAVENAVQAGAAVAVAALLAAQASVPRRVGGTTLLHRAAKAGISDMVEVLLEYPGKLV